MNRRNLLKNMGLGLSAGMIGAGIPSSSNAQSPSVPNYKNGTPPVKITKVKAIPTCPHGIELIVVKVETSEPGLYGLGCATFRQRGHAVVSAINDYLDDFCRGKDVDNIEDIWQTTYVSSYWRNGPVLNNALSGLDQALWDIKGKRAGMPVYQLLGGKLRFAVDCYAHASGSTPQEVAESVQGYIDQGFRHVRIQMGGYGASQLLGGYGEGAGQKQQPDFKAAGFGTPNDNVMDTVAYTKSVVDMFAQVRKSCGERVELLHDIHERVQPMEAIRMMQQLEEYRPFFIEDPFSPENVGYFKLLREHTTVPIAMGELFNNQNEWLDIMKDRLIDYIRIHISQIGGITPAMKVARLGEWFNVKTAWHGPGDVSPVGHSANAHIDLAVWNFGIQESVHFSDLLREIFPGSPEMKNGYMHINEVPGLGVDVNEKLALKYPFPEKFDYNWTQLRKPDGTPVRP
ncbi:enolase C-terminal domain-like protein [Catalinimonas niigatensis]|uniref:enolase C-terminal domain-like protein n=1 Tax=Catalinimonas niigatensis TaxID=1397264 RepID=UPI0026658742|nr:enolase C-terminal domain-like protein [Catalinimonas niigatensis]WPP50192.1 enolase C-terminal domain-like protein [Catalinimonas niigatensis]